MHQIYALNPHPYRCTEKLNGNLQPQKARHNHCPNWEGSGSEFGQVKFRLWPHCPKSPSFIFESFKHGMYNFADAATMWMWTNDSQREMKKDDDG